MNQNDMNKKSMSLGLNRASRVGSWTLAVTLIFLAVLIVINLLVAALPGRFTQFDTTNNGRYTLSQTTEKFVKGIDRNVELIVVSQNASVDATLQNFLERYTALNGKIKYRVVDPVADPTFLEKYSEIVGTGRYIIVQSDLRYHIVDTQSLETVYITDAKTAIDLYTYEQLMADESIVNAYAQYYGIDLNNVVYYFNGEQAITSAIEYVVAEQMPHLYLFSTGDGSAFSSMMDDILEAVMLTYEPLTLNVGDSVPDDASCVIINAPSFDLTDSQYQALSAFVAEGGNLILLTKPDNTTMPKLMSLVAPFGVTPTTDGALSEGNANKYVGSATVLLPTVNTQNELTYTAYANNLAMVMPNAHGILIDETLPTGVTVTSLFNASDAYTATADHGAVSTGVLAENTETGAKLTWIASADAFSDSSASTYGSGSFYYFALLADSFNDGYASTLTAIEGMQIGAEYLTVSSLAIRVVSVILFAIPAAILISGIVVWVRRRRR